MSRKHYAEMVSVIRVNMMFAKTDESKALLKRVAKDMCIVFKQDNSFDSGKFLDACGFEAD